MLVTYLHMISLYSVKNIVNFDTTNLERNKLFHIEKKNKESKFVENILLLEKKIIFKQGFPSMNITVEFSNLSNVINRNYFIDINCNKVEIKYVLCFPIYIKEKDRYYITSQINGKKSSLIINSEESTCVGFCNCKINITNECKNNVYLFVFFSNNPLINTYHIDFLKDENVNEEMILQPINKSDLDIIEYNEENPNITEYLSTYDTKNTFTFIKFHNKTFDSDIFDLEELEVINTPIFGDERINNHLIYIDLNVYYSNIVLTLSDFYLSKPYFIVNKINPGFIGSYLSTLVRQYIEDFSFPQENKENIVITINSCKPNDAIIAIPLIESIDDNSRDEKLFFIKSEIIKEYHNIDSNINYLYASKCNFNCVYFLRDHLSLLSLGDRKFCFISLRPPCTNDSEYFLDTLKKDAEDIKSLQMKKMNIPSLNNVDLNLFSITDSYTDIIARIKCSEKINNKLSKFDVVRLSRNYFDVIENNEEEKLYDIINIKNVFTLDTINKIGNIDMNNDNLKAIYLQLASNIYNYYNLKKINVTDIKYHETRSITLKPPDNYLHITLIINTKENITVSTNTCYPFNPIMSSGSILIYTYKKELTLDSKDIFSILVYYVKII